MRFLVILVSTVTSWRCPMMVCPFAHIVSERANELVLYNVNCLSHLNILSYSLTFAFSSVDFSHWVTSDSLWPHGLQRARPPCPSPTPGASSNSCPIKSVMPFNHLILCGPLLLLPWIFPSIRVFPNESVLHVRWPEILELQLQHQSFQWIFRTDFL